MTLLNKSPFLIFLILTAKVYATDLCHILSGKQVIQGAKSCPTIKKGNLLHRLHKESSVIIGQPIDLNYSHTLIDILNQLPKGLQKNILLSHEISHVTTQLISNYKNVKLLKYHGEDFTWAQDFLPFITDKNGKKSIFNIPYPDEYIRSTSSKLAKSCQISELNTFKKGFDYEKVGPGDFGGNIYPLTDKTLFVGDNISEEVISKLEKNTDQQIEIIDTSWFETGHVDEVISLLPGVLKKDQKSCDFTVAIPSPSLAMNLINMDITQREELINFKDYLNETSDAYYNCLQLLAESKKDNFSSKLCRSFRDYNLEMDKIFNRNLETVKKALKRIDKCDLKSIIPLPVLLAPIDKTSDKSVLGYSRFITFNPINNILIEKQVILPKQNYTPFTDYISETLKRLKLNTSYVNSSFLQYLAGGPHCNVKVIRTCKRTN